MKNALFLILGLALLQTACGKDDSKKNDSTEVTPDLDALYAERLEWQEGQLAEFDLLKSVQEGDNIDKLPGKVHDVFWDKAKYDGKRKWLLIGPFIYTSDESGAMYYIHAEVDSDNIIISIGNSSELTDEKIEELTDITNDSWQEQCPEQPEHKYCNSPGHLNFKD